MVFSDLDGTLIDHETYTFAPARPALNALAVLCAPLILASSKTAPEISVIRRQMGAEQWPAIVENGAGLLPAFSKAVPDDSDYRSVRAALDALPADLRTAFCGFGDVSVDQIVKITGLTPPDAALARQRSFSEPGQWLGTEDQKTAFLTALAELGITAQQGGRFLTLSRGRNKVDQMKALIAKYEPGHTVALGDAPNDIAMLEAADFGVVIANPNHGPLPPLKFENTGCITRTEQPGPQGWNTAVLALLHHLELQ